MGDGAIRGDYSRTHLEMAIADRVARGESPESAAANARREFGNVGLATELAREPFRKHSYLTDIAIGLVTGFGATSYRLAMEVAIERLNKSWSVKRAPKKPARLR